MTDQNDNTPPQNPWGQRKKPSEPQSIWEKKRKSSAPDDLLNDFQERIRKAFGDGDGGGFFSSPLKGFAAGAAILLGVWMASGFFRVQEGEVGVVMRFGENVRISGPGLQYHLPTPIENVIIQKIGSVNRIDGGMRADTKNGEGDQVLTLTADENMVVISYSVQWRIKDVSEFLFTARDPEGLIIVASESAIREIIGQTVARLALTEGREAISQKAQELLQKILDSYKLGVQIMSFQLQRVEAPQQVIESFNDVQASLVDADRLRNEAEAYKNQIVPVARGNAERIKQEAQAYAKKVIAEAEGEAVRFNQIHEAYSKNKGVTLNRHYFDTMTRVLKSSKNKIILDPKAAKDLVPYLPVNELRKKPAPTTPEKEEKK